MGSAGSMPDRAAVDASMRPRRVRLGWLVPGTASARHAWRFNEAEARTPRMRVAPGLQLASSYERFNEAEARTPRMARRMSRQRAASRFNEAEARTPRMRADRSERAVAESRFNEAEARTPRMRRRRHVRGSQSTRFNEAEARTPRMRDSSPPGSGNAERASMRPRRVRLGCASAFASQVPSLSALQ